MNADIMLLAFDGGDTFTTMSEQRDVTVQAGYYVGALKIQPFLRVEQQDFRSRVN